MRVLLLNLKLLYCFTFSFTLPLMCIFEDTDSYIADMIMKLSRLIRKQNLQHCSSSMCLRAGKGCKQVLTNNDEIALVLPKNKGFCFL